MKVVLHHQQATEDPQDTQVIAQQMSSEMILGVKSVIHDADVFLLF